MLSIDRKDFCPGNVDPYEDTPQRIGFNVTISAPHMHAYPLVNINNINNINIIDIINSIVQNNYISLPNNC